MQPTTTQQQQWNVIRHSWRRILRYPIVWVLHTKLVMCDVVFRFFRFLDFVAVESMILTKWNWKVSRNETEKSTDPKIQWAVRQKNPKESNMDLEDPRIQPYNGPSTQGYKNPITQASRNPFMETSWISRLNGIYYMTPIRVCFLCIRYI